MRYIIFRAKCVDNGEWVRGVPHFENNKCFMITDLLIYEEYQCTGAENVEVIPETVGQYTGLTDKNGKMIFEGDIVKNQYNKNEYLYFKVFYNIDDCCWECENKYKMTGKLCNVIGDMEVVGNEHDNPELLEGV